MNTQEKIDQLYKEIDELHLLIEQKSKEINRLNYGKYAPHENEYLTDSKFTKYPS